MDKRHLRTMAAAVLLTALLLGAACSSTNTPDDVNSTPSTGTPASSRFGGRFTPFLTATATVTPTLADPSTPTPLPSPTATPRSHEVKQGEDLGGIAYRYGVTLEDLRAANPTVNPNLLSIGTLLVIPESKTPMPSTEPPTPTPVPVTLGPLYCTRATDGGAWCFQSVENTQDYPLESLNAIFRLSDQRAQEIIPQHAFLPLDILPPGAILPLYAYYPPENIAAVSGPLVSSAELQGALPHPEDGRYLPAELTNQKALIRGDGRSAQISAEVRLAEGTESAAKRVWVAAVAYDAQGRITGVRRWEMPAEKSLEPGQSLPVIFDIYSVAEPIARIDVFAEARP